MAASKRRVVVVGFEGATVEEVRVVAEREGWQMPLTPFIADGDQFALVRTVGKLRG